MGHSKKPGAPGRTTIPPAIVSSVTKQCLAIFKKLGFDRDYHLFIVPQQCYLYVEAQPMLPEDRDPPPLVTTSSTTHKPLGRLKYLGGTDRWEYQPYLWADEWWDERLVETGTSAQLFLGILVYKM
ncbi:MAG: hypothetical protein HY905_00325 [Deltaproteobacteria bacterium]|nr:hypothetical protein [Deltaproteobacteria bacterium]